MHLGVLAARVWAGSAWEEIWPTARRLSAGLGTTYYGLYDTLDVEKSDLFCLALSFCTGWSIANWALLKYPRMSV